MRMAGGTAPGHSYVQMENTMIKGATRIPREMPPWYPEWTIDANCTPEKTGLSIAELDEIFFDSGKRSRLIKKAKAICATCPVIRNCYEANREIPLGTFYGKTQLERWRLRGMKGRPDSSQGYSYFAHFYGKYWNGPKLQERIANGMIYSGE